MGDSLAGEREAVLPIAMLDFPAEGDEGILDEVFVASFEFACDLLGEHEIEGLFLGSAAGDEHRDE